MPIGMHVLTERRRVIESTEKQWSEGQKEGAFRVRASVAEACVDGSVLDPARRRAILWDVQRIQLVEYPSAPYLYLLATTGRPEVDGYPWLPWVCPLSASGEGGTEGLR